MSDIGSGIYTGRETRRIRNAYRIKGTYCDDITKGIFCQPCSLIRNDLEIRRREKDRGLELTLGLRAPVPLGEQAFRPMYAMPVTEGYQGEPRMTTSNVPQDRGREVHFHPVPKDRNGERGEGARVVPLYPTEQDLSEANNAWGGVIDLPEIPDISSPLVDLERRPQLLTPISERDSTESPRTQQLHENKPNFPQVQHWLKSMSPHSGNKASAEKSVAVPDQGSSPTSAASSKPFLDSRCSNPREKPANPSKPTQKGKIPSRGGKKRSAETRDAPDIHVTPALEAIAAIQQLPKAARPEPVTKAATDTQVETTEIRRSPKHNLSADVLVPSPSTSERQHSLQADVLVPSPSASERQHSFQADMLVPSPSAFECQRSLQADVFVSNPSTLGRQHNLQEEVFIPNPSALERQHRLQVDVFVSSPSTLGRQHSLEADILVPSLSASERQHSLQADTFVSTPAGSQRQHSLHNIVPQTDPPGSGRQHSLRDDLPLPGLSAQRQHSLNDDVLYTSSPGSGRQHSLGDGVLLSPPPEPRQSHSLQVDPRIPTPSSLARDHSLSADNRVQFPPLTSRAHYLDDDARMLADEPSIRKHSLGFDDVVSVEDDPEPEPEPELEPEPWGYNLAADTQVPVSPLSAPTHNIESGTLVAIPVFEAREHSLSGEPSVPAPASRRKFAHGIHLDERIPDPELVRLYLDHDILQDRRVLTPSPKNTEHGLQADKKVKMSNPFFPRQHSVRSDGRMPEPIRKPREHSLRADETVPSSSRRKMDHSISSDPKVAQRAYRLLENFLEKEKKSMGKGPK